MGTEASGVSDRQARSSDPVNGHPLGDVDPDVVAPAALGEQGAFAVGRVGAALADQSGEVGVAVLHIVEPCLKEAHAGVLRDGWGHHRTDPGERAVGTNDQIGLHGCAVGEGRCPRPFGRATDPVQGVPPPHGAGLKRIEQQRVQLTAVDLGLVPVVRARDVVGLDFPGRVQ
ncbi:hypothetical protein [Saccharopolyspora thermophila]|uniref:hypothetical protein n=1 Tax=Saccharopolyspora thermophila TaxID=89367 RepID=UPI001E2ADC5B|nr:hypothetical protein [Saccharopolyspora subtropica]